MPLVNIDIEKTKTDILKLTSDEKEELNNIKSDYLFYKGAFTDTEMKKLIQYKKNNMIGQSWFLEDKLKYTPTRAIDNITQELIDEQARFFLGKEPTLLFKLNDREMGSNNKEQRDELEQFRIFIDRILDDNRFWAKLMHVFKLATVTRRVLIRLEANANEPIGIFFHDVSEFNYKMNNRDELEEVDLVYYIGFDENTKKHLFKKYIYYIKKNEADISKCYLKEETYEHTDISTPIKVQESETMYSVIPACVIFNERDFYDNQGKSDIEQLKTLQNQYNRRFSDYADALRFQMFGMTVFKDCTEESVKGMTIAPNSALIIETTAEARENSQQADVTKVESTFSSAEPINAYLDRIRNSMGDKLSIPRKESLKQIPSAKALKFIYNDLIARCEQKWKDWEPGIFRLINLIIQSCSELNCYPEFNKSWLGFDFSMSLKKNFPIPDDEEDSKRLAIEEVNANVRSHRNYIKEYGNEEDYDEAFKEVVEDMQIINESTLDPIGKALMDESKENNNGEDKNVGDK